MSRTKRMLVIDPTLASAALMILAVAAMRLLPHPPNFTPVLAMALFGGARLGNRSSAVAVPLGALLLSDVAIEIVNGHGLHLLLPVVYLCVALCVGVGWRLCRRRGVVRVAGAAVGGAVLFYLVTNFAVWALWSRYPMNLTGLVECYVAAVPFFRGTLLGTLLYSGALFSAHELVRMRVRRSSAHAA
jgi:hypothetical protein